MWPWNQSSGTLFTGLICALPRATLLRDKSFRVQPQPARTADHDGIGFAVAAGCRAWCDHQGRIAVRARAEQRARAGRARPMALFHERRRRGNRSARRSPDPAGSANARWEGCGLRRLYRPAVGGTRWPVRGPLYERAVSTRHAAARLAVIHHAVGVLSPCVGRARQTLSRCVRRRSVRAAAGRAQGRDHRRARKGHAEDRRYGRFLPPAAQRHAGRLFGRPCLRRQPRHGGLENDRLSGARYDYRDWVDRHNERFPLPPIGIAQHPNWKE